MLALSDLEVRLVSIHDGISHLQLVVIRMSSTSLYSDIISE